MGNRSRNIAARRKLSDLYARGVHVRFSAEGAKKGPFDGPPSEEEVEVYVAPPSPLQREMALRDAQAVRSRAVLRAKRETDSEEHLTALAFISQMTPETLIEYVIQAEGDDREREAIRDVMGKDEWDDLASLQDAMRQYEEAGQPEDDPEYVALLQRDTEFGQQVRERLAELEASAREIFQMAGREALEKKAMERRAELLSGQVFMRSYERHMLFYGVRDPEDHQELFFENVEELAQQPEFVQEELSNVLAEFISDGGQAKNSLRVVSGSDSSAPPAEPETSEASTPEAASG